MEDQLRRSAGFWRVVASIAMLLGVIGSVVIAIAVSRTEGYFGEETDVGLLIGVLAGSLLAVVLSLGFFFMGTRLMDGLAELLDRTPPKGGARGHQPSAPQREVSVVLDEDRLVAPLQTAVEGMRRVALARGQFIAVTSISDTRALVDTGSGKFQLTLGDDGKAKVEPL